ncbi:MAG: S26 family signal peptidase [Pseudomonadota bacterium]
MPLFGWGIMRIDGDSMVPTLNDGDYVVYRQLSASQKAALNIGDIIAFRYADPAHMVKRITAIYDGWLNVAGDSPHSMGSQAIGPVQLDDIIGIARLRIAPSGLSKL